MKNVWIYVLLLAALSLGGCASDYAPVWTAGLNAAGEPITEIGGYVKDASISKESLITANLTNYYNAYTKAHNQSGFEMEFEMVELAPGLKMWMPKKVKYRDEPQFAQLVKPPTEPSKHPVWTTVDNIVDKGLWAFIGWAGFDYLKDVSSNSGGNYNFGSDANFNNSFNPGNSGSMTPGTVYNGPYAPIEGAAPETLEAAAGLVE